MNQKVLTGIMGMGMTLLAVTGCQSSTAGTDNKSNSSQTQHQKKSTTNQSDSSGTAKKSSNKTSTSSDKPAHLPIAEALPAVVVQNAVGALHTKLTKYSPDYFPLADHNAYLTAVTSSGDNQYKMMYYSYNKPIKVNSDTAKSIKADNELAVFSAQSYASATKAKDAVKAQPKMTNASGMDLGHSIQGTVIKGKGTSRLIWHDQGWSFEIDAPSMLGMFAIENAKQFVSYLQNHKLPVPHSAGSILVNYGKNHPQTVVNFQENTTVYSLTTAQDPTEALKMAVSIKKYK